MDVLAELESMAATADVDVNDNVDAAVLRWQNIFQYSAEEAESQIMQQRSELTAVVSRELWDTVKEHQEASGHDRESYSHWLKLSRRAKPTACSQQADSDASDREYLFKLESPISDIATLRDIAGLPEPPKLHHGTSENGTQETFCLVDGRTRELVKQWALKQAPEYRPLFMPLSKALKRFDTFSDAPVLGRDSTLPQNRPTTFEAASPKDNYPVWYFFYGTLADQEVLARLFAGLDEAAEYDLRPASITGGILTTWDGKYKALVDDVGLYSAPPVKGHAFLVRSEEHEDALRYYETQAYEVVRCKIQLENAADVPVHGCTFRFRGNRY